MKKYAVTVASIAVLLLFSGCTTFPDLFSSSFSPVEPVSEEMTNDVIVVKNLKSVPERVYTSSEFSLIFILKHEGEPASSMEAKNVKVEFYDWGLCKPKGESGDTFAPIPGKTFTPQEEEMVEVEFSAPSNEELANMPGSCPIRFRVTYDYSAVTQVDMKVISSEKKKELQMTGKYQEYSPKQVIGLGPLKIYFTFTEPQPVTEKKRTMILFQVKNVGEGRIENGKIKMNTLAITFPSDFKNIQCDKMRCSGNTCKNSEEIDFVRDATSSLRCFFSLPPVRNQKTFYITGRLNYTYEIDKEIEVPIIPVME